MLATGTLATDNFLIPNGTFLAELVLFAILLGIFMRFIVPPIQRAMRERQELIWTQLEEAQQAKERAEAAEAGYKRFLDEARAEAAKIREDARLQGRKIVEEARAKAEAEAERELAHGRQHLTTEREALARELRAGVGVLAVDLAGRVVGEPLVDEAFAAELVEDFV